MANRWGNNGNHDRLFSWAPKSLEMVTAAMKLKDSYSLEEKYNQPRQHIEKQRHYFANKGPSCQGYGISSSRVWMWELDYKESWVPKNWCFWTAVLEKTLESPLDCKEIQPVHPKGDQFWVFIGRTDVEAETQYFGHLMRRTDSLEKTWCWEGLKAGGEGDDREWDGWIASLTQWTWVWVNSRSWWWTGRPGVLQSMGSQSQTQLSDWTEYEMYLCESIVSCEIYNVIFCVFQCAEGTHYSVTTS